jgi:phosphoglycolate phosphatase-like HAD superfamily hydrolase/ADP-ribose pyrophosphatase YjhB (NUDIX family)
VILNVILDWSGTLVDDLRAVLEATNFVMRQAGVPEFSLEQFRAEFSLPYTEFYRRYTPHISTAQLEAWFFQHFPHVQHTIVELPHAREFLAFCRKNRLQTLLLSTVPYEHYSDQAARFGFDRYFDHAYLGVRDKRAKIHELLAEHHLEPRQTLFVGDMQHDIEAAACAGILSCAVLTGYNSLEQLRACKPDLVVEDLGELRRLLERNSLELGAPAGGDGAGPVRRPVVTVGALIFNEHGEVLMVRTRKWSNLWGIPGGKVRYGEACIDALERELKEETNLGVGDIRFVMVQDCIGSKEFHRDEHFLLLNYTCRCVGSPQVKLNDEAQEFRWVSVSGALKMHLNTPTRALLEKVASACPKTD